MKSNFFLFLIGIIFLVNTVHAGTINVNGSTTYQDFNGWGIETYPYQRWNTYYDYNFVGTVSSLKNTIGIDYMKIRFRYDCTASGGCFMVDCNAANSSVAAIRTNIDKQIFEKTTGTRAAIDVNAPAIERIVDGIDTADMNLMVGGFFLPACLKTGNDFNATTNNYNILANYWQAIFQAFDANGHVPEYFIMINEPEVSSTGVFTAAKVSTAIGTIKARLNSLGYFPIILGADASTALAEQTTYTATMEADSNVSVRAYHGYDGNSLNITDWHYAGNQGKTDINALDISSTKPLWMTEWTPDGLQATDINHMGLGLAFANNIHNAVTIGNISSYTLWNFGGGGNDVLRDYSGTADVNYNPQALTAAHYFRFIKNGTKRILVNDQPDANILVSAYESDQNFALVIINMTSATATETINLSNTIPMSTLYVKRTSGTGAYLPEQFLDVNTITNDTNTIVAFSLPARSVTTIYGGITVGAGAPATAPVITATPRTNYALNSALGSIDVNWSDVPDEDDYTIYRSTNGTVYSTVATIAAGSTGYTNTSLADNTLYYFKVQANGASGDTNSNTVSTFTPDRTAPNHSNNLAGTYTLNQINLTWSKGTDNNSSQTNLDYNVMRSTTAIDNNASYSIITRLDDAASYSNVTGTDNANPNATTISGIVANSSSQLTVSWSASTDNNTTYYYKVKVIDEQSNDSNTNSITVAALSGISKYWVTNTTTSTTDLNTASLSYAKTGLDANTTYCFTVKAADRADNNSSSSASSCKFTLANVPSAPTVGSATPTTLGVTINVNANPTATQFAVYDANLAKWIQSDGNASGASETWQTNAQWGTITATGFDENSQHCFQVKARNGENTATALGAQTCGTAQTQTTAPPISVSFFGSISLVSFIPLALVALFIFAILGQFIITRDFSIEGIVILFGTLIAGLIVLMLISAMF